MCVVVVDAYMHTYIHTNRHYKLYCVVRQALLPACTMSLKPDLLSGSARNAHQDKFALYTGMHMLTRCMIGRQRSAVTGHSDHSVTFICSCSWRR